MISHKIEVLLIEISWGSTELSALTGSLCISSRFFPAEKCFLEIWHLPSKFCFKGNFSFLGQSFSRGHYQPIYQPPFIVFSYNFGLSMLGLLLRFRPTARERMKNNHFR